MNKYISKINIKLVVIIIPLLIQILFSLVYNYYAIMDYRNFIDYVKQNNRVNPLIPLNSAFTYWIGGISENIYKKIFYYGVFLGAVFPCLFFISFNKKNHKSSFYTSFFIGFMFAFFSLIFSFITTLLFIPAISPDSAYDIYYDVINGDTFCNLFYTAPVIYELIYILMISFICGLICCLGYGCYKLYKDNLIVFFIPFLLLIIVHIVDIHYSFEKNISPIIYSNVAVTTIRSLKQYFIEVSILLFLIMVSFVIHKKIHRLKST